MIGRRLGHFDVIELLGSGAMGNVYRARDERLHRDVALKVLPPGTIADAATRERFRREAMALSQVNHPNVATMYDFDTQDGVDFLVMELVDGESLSDVIAARAPLPEPEVVELGVQLADGLGAAHQQNIVHRDLKPANLRLTPEGRLKILDFGLAKGQRTAAMNLPTLTEVGSITGTLSHMAPEQLQGGVVDARADLYAAGVVFYELATGRHPFAGLEPARLMYCILNQRPEPPSRWNPRIGSALDATVLRLLEKQPENRHASAGELRDDLRGAAAQTPPQALPARRGISRRWVAANAAAVLVLGIGVTMIAQRGAVSRWLGASAAGRIQSLAVLPLENLSHDPEQDYFAEGMTDALITTLAQVGSLRVISRTSVMRFRGTALSLPEIARSLHVDAIVEGTVLRSGDRVRISAQLIRAATDQNLWAQSFERDLRDVLALQSDVARAIAERIKVQLTPGQTQRLKETRQVDPEAYQACLRGRYAWSQYTLAGFQQSYRLFRRAIEIDPTYAPAYAGLADAYYGNSSAFMPPNDAIPQARAAAQKALALDSTLAPAHTSLGIVKMVYDLDWSGAEREFRRSVELQPNDADAHLWLGHMLACQARFDEALTELHRALDLDPLSPWIRANLGWHLYFARRYAEAAEVFTVGLRTDPDFYIYHVFLGLTLEQQGDHARALAELTKGIAISRNNDNEAQLGQVYGLAGRRADAERIVAQLLERRKTEFVPAANLAVVYAALGRRDKALEWLDKAFADHSEGLIFLKVDPGLDPLRSDPRFAAILKRAGLAG